jgi:hypothetical protein
MVVIDTHLARGASNGGFTFHDRGGPYGRTNLMSEHLSQQGVTDSAAGRLQVACIATIAPPVPGTSAAASSCTRSLSTNRARI